MISTMRTTGVVVLVVAMIRSAYADPEQDRVVAETRFQEGRQLQKQGKDQEACEKFREALKLDHNAVGAILNVARCDEEVGLIASAAKLFADARDRAREAQEGNTDTPLLRAAGDHIAQLTPDIPYLALAFSEGPTAGTRVVVNNEPVAPDATTHIPVDPGVVTVVVSQPGRVQYETKVSIQKREQKAIIIPKLAYPVVVNNARRNVGRIIALSGAVIGVGSIGFAAWGQGYYDADIKRDCPTIVRGQHECNNPSEQSTANTWATRGDIATAVGVAGAIAVVAGTYLWLSGRHEEHLAVVPALSTSYAGVAATGRF
jgi:hypothetical protein